MSDGIYHMLIGLDGAPPWRLLASRFLKALD